MEETSARKTQSPSAGGGRACLLKEQYPSRRGAGLSARRRPCLLRGGDVPVSVEEPVSV